MTGTQLRKWRLENRLTQNAAALLIGVSYAAYKKWESEKRADMDIPEPVARLVALL